MKSFRNYLKPGKAKAAATPSEVATPTPTAGSIVTGSRSSVNFPGSRVSLYPQGDFRNSNGQDILDIKSDVMVNWLHQQQLNSGWSSQTPHEGVMLKKTRNNYACCPAEISEYREDFYDAVKVLNVKAAMTVNTRVIKLFLKRTEMTYVPLQDGLRLQILPSIAYLPACQKHHFAAFILDTSLLVVWDDEPKHLLARAKDIENQLMSMIWEIDEPFNPLSEKGEKGSGISGVVTEVSADSSVEDLAEDLAEKPRRLVLTQAFMCGCTLMLITAALGAGWRQISQELAVDSNYLRIAFVVVVPAQIWLSLFFMQAIVGCLIQLLGPINQMHTNTKYYSGTRPRRLRGVELPHVTIQCPVYKEGLRAVIQPTIMSVKAAISTYEMQGGTANIFVNDDGMQLVSPEEAQARREYYEEHNIGWVARPKHNPKPAEGEQVFVRGGKFKKASNMNYAMGVSARIEDKLAALQRPAAWNADDEADAYTACLEQVIAEDEGRTWAAGNVRIGDYILIIDSDTRVPADCFLDAVSEMEQSPQVAILQFTSGVMNITTSFFENGITFFTNLVYTAIGYAVACGDVAPFVGHNAMLRWSAVQDVAYSGGAEGEAERYWSESTVSEDFDMALRLQTAGYISRFANYTGDGFKEGVSLTVYDELARWEKYAFGCNELIFHPLRYWPTRGPFTKLFRNFIGSSMPLPSKMTIMAYIGTYYAIGSAWILTLMNYFIMGWFNGYIDHYYIDSFEVFFSLIVVFTALGNIALAVLRYRLGTRSLGGALVENFKWVPLLAVFLGGLSLHVSQALVSHMVGIDMAWGATAKEVEDTTFFAEVPKLLRRFKGTFAYCLLSAAMMIALARFAPPLWRIDAFIAIFPLGNIITSHFLLPVVLNPSLMLFTW